MYTSRNLSISAAPPPVCPSPRMIAPPPVMPGVSVAPPPIAPF